ncbi:hypothetical protein [Streptomyces sp. SAS_275]|uniref:hypothetical protein n=1 Tax=Streptomyces sp. SAS_275 TaxID=3412746 RepID=UPI00403C32FA
MRERLSAVRWTHLITVGGAGLAAFAAIGGLWAQAVATYWTQETAKDQLSQSQEDSRREQQAQASQVTFWVEPSKSGRGLGLHVLNRSLDPVTNVRVGASVFEEGYFYGLAGWDLPPCTEEIFDADNMFIVTPKDGGAKEDRRPYPLVESSFTFLGFVDSHGGRWARSETALTDMSDSEILIDPNVPLLEGFGEIELSEPVVKRADNCGDNHA